MFETLIRSGTVSADAIASRTGLPATGIDSFLDRLTQVGHVSRTDVGDPAEARSGGR